MRHAKNIIESQKCLVHVVHFKMKLKIVAMNNSKICVGEGEVCILYSGAKNYFDTLIFHFQMGLTK